MIVDRRIDLSMNMFICPAIARGTLGRLTRFAQLGHVAEFHPGGMMASNIHPTGFVSLASALKALS